MPFAREQLIKDIERRLTHLAGRIKGFTSPGLGDSAKFLEPFAARLLNASYDWQLADPDPGNPTTKGIDLVDPVNFVAVQVTVQESSEKIVHTANMVSDGKLDAFTIKAVFLFNHVKHRNDHGLRLINIPVLIADLMGKDVPVLESIEALIKVETASVERTLDDQTRLRAHAQPCNLPYRPLGALFMGRDGDMAKLRDALHSGAQRAGINMQPQVAAAHGLGGIGKTRLACEYAWQHAGDYDALLSADASSPDSLPTSIAGLSTALVHHLDLPVSAPDDERRAAVIAWLQASAPSLRDGSIQSAAGSTSSPGDHSSPREEKSRLSPDGIDLSRSDRARARPGGALLILDNIDDPPAAGAVRDLLRHIPRVSVILTGRIPRWFENVTPLALGVLSVEDSAAFLLQRTVQRTPTAGDAQQARLLAEKLDGLALLLEQAASWINDRGATFAGYLHAWDAKHQECLQWWDETQSHVAGGTRPYGPSVFTTWLTTVETLTPDARLLLDLCAWFAPEPIPEWIMEHAATEKLNDLLSASNASDTGEPAAAPVQLDADSLHALIRSGMATRVSTGPAEDPRSRAFLLHRIVQDVTRQRQQPAETADELCLRAIDWMDDLFTGEVDAVANWPQFDPIVPHARHCAALADEQAAHHAPVACPSDATLESRAMSPAPHLAGRLYWSLALWTASHGNIHAAVDWGRLALARLLAVLGPEHPNTLGARNNLAAALQAQGKNAEAEAEHRAVLAVRVRVLGPEHPDTLTSRNNLTAALQEQGKGAEAEAEHRAVLAVRERVLGPEHPDTLQSHNNLAAALNAQGKCAEAEAEFRTMLAVRISVLGVEHPDTLTSRNNLAIALQAQGKHVEAGTEHRAVLAVWKDVLGPEHPDTLMSRNNLAAALKAQGKHAEAEQEHRAVLAVQERVLGPEHPDTLYSRGNLANTLLAQGKNAEAEAEYRAIIAGMERVIGPEHPHTLNSHINLAISLRAQEKWPEALAEAEHARAGWLRVLGAGHSLTQNADRLVAIIREEKQAAEGGGGE